MESKLGLNVELVDQARASAAKVADDVQHFIDQHTTVTVERAVCRLLGIDGVNDMDVPLPNVVVEHLTGEELSSAGRGLVRSATPWCETGKDPQAVAEAVDRGELDLTKVPAHGDAEIRAAHRPRGVRHRGAHQSRTCGKRNAYLKECGDKEGPTCTSSWLPATSTRISPRPRPAPSRAPTSSP